VYLNSVVKDINVGIDNSTVSNPTGFFLNQNYPNPFNPSTTISFQLPNKTYVTLKVYDPMGREVMVLVDEIRSAGIHKLEFNGSGLSSGTYFVRLQAGYFSETKKLILQK
jgi:hypothetical protein